MKKKIEVAIVSFIMAALSLVSTFPLVKSFTTSIPWSSYRNDISWSLLNHPGDHLQLFYFFWLVKQNILGRVPFNGNPYEFNMLGGQTAGNDGFTTAPLAFISFLFSPLGDVTAYNCTVISSYVLAGVFMYLLARMITDFKLGALLAAITITFVPLRINGMAGGNQYGFVLFFYPMIFYFLEKCIATQKMKYSFLAGLAIVGLSFNEPHLIYYFFMCMGVYLPIRFFSLIPVKQSSVSIAYPFRLRKVVSWPPWFSLLLIWGGWVALVVCAHSLIPRQGDNRFFSPVFWWMVGYYPLIPLFVSLMLAFLYRHFSDKITHQHSLAIEAVSTVPLYFLLVPAFVFYGQALDMTIVFAGVLCTVSAIKIWMLRLHFFTMLAHLLQKTLEMKETLIAFSPALFGMLVTVILTVINKKRSLAPSTESGGRTLREVRLYSAHIQDLFIPTHSVYLGWLAVGFAVVFLGYLLYKASCRCNTMEKPTPNQPLYALLAVVFLISHALALGLALGNRSLYILFFNYMPFFNIPRVSERFLSVTVLVLACVMAGISHNIIRRYKGRFWKAFCSIIFLLLIVIQLKSYHITDAMAISDLQPIEPGYQFIKDNIGDAVLLELPIWPGDSHQSSVYEYYSTLDRVKRINGYSPLVSREYLETVFAPLHSLDRGGMDKDQYDLLRRLNVKYITVHEHRDIFPAKVSPYAPLTTVRRLNNSPYLEYLGPWPIINNKYKKVHERLNIFKVKENVVSTAESYYEMPRIYRPGSRLRQQIGGVVLDKSIGREVFNAVPGRDKPGALVFGPYDSYFSGNYSCYFRLKCSGKGETGTIIDVAKSSGRERVLARKEITAASCDGTYQNYSLDFAIPKRERMEYRVFCTGTDEVSLDRIVVGKKETEEILHFWEAEKMVGDTGRIVLVPEASGQKVLEAKPGKDRPGRIVYGPDRRYEKGSYSAFFYLRRIDSSNKVNKRVNVVKIAITGQQGSNVFARKRVASRRLSTEKFTGIKVDFTLAEDEEVDFTVRFTNKEGVQLDGIEIVNNNMAEVY